MCCMIESLPSPVTADDKSFESRSRPSHTTLWEDVALLPFHCKRGWLWSVAVCQENATLYHILTNTGKDSKTRSCRKERNQGSERDIQFTKIFNDVQKKI